MKSFSSMGVKSKVALSLVLVLVLAGVGVFAFAANTGRIKTKADVVPKTVTVTGKVTDATTNTPVPGVKVLAGAYGRTAAQVMTNASGDYRAALSINATDPLQNMITVKYNDASHNVTTEPLNTFNISENNNTNIPLTNDFKVTAPLNNNTGTGVCYENKDRADFYLKRKYGNLPYKDAQLNGVTICMSGLDASDDINAVIAEHTDDLNFVTNFINSLKNQTGLGFVPRLYVNYWKGGANLLPGHEEGWELSGTFGVLNFTDPVNQKNLNNSLEVGKYFGRILDYQLGYKSNTDKTNLICYQSLVDTTSWNCPHSSQKDFDYAIIAANNRNINDATGKLGIEGMWYEDVFSYLFATTDLNTYPLREKLQYFTKNLMLGKYSVTTKYGPDLTVDDVGSVYTILCNDDTCTKLNSIPRQNALMYIYKFVAKDAKIDEYFPGTLSKSYTNDQITKGLYMPTAVLSLRIGMLETFDRSRGMEFTSGNISDKSFTTREYLTSGRFSDGSGDLFDTAGTEVVLNASTTSKDARDYPVLDVPNPPDYMAGAVFSPVSLKSLVRGSNSVIKSDYIMNPTGPLRVNASPPYPSVSAKGVRGKMIIYHSTRVAYPIYKGQMTRYPDRGSNPIVDNSTGIKMGNVGEDGDVLAFCLGGDQIPVVVTIYGTTPQGRNIFIENFVQRRPHNLTAGKACTFQKDSDVGDCRPL